MNYEQVLAVAESEAGYLIDGSIIKIWVASSAGNAAAGPLCGAFQSEIVKHGISAVIIKAGSCGCYDLEPIVIIEKPACPALLYTNVTPDRAVRLLKESPENSGAFCSLGDNKIQGVPNASDLPIFRLQNRIALRNCGLLDPENIHHYILRGNGYAALARALKDPTRRREANAADKSLICNAVDEDGALTAQLLLESNPHSVLEGMLISAYSLGASFGVLYVKEGNGHAGRINRALAQMRRYNLLGSRILDSSFGCELEVREVPDSVTFGAGSSILCSLSENQTLPYLSPTYPGIDEFRGKAAVIVNAEKMAGISANFSKGKARRVVTLRGGIIHPYTVEIAEDTSIRDILEEIGGGAPAGKRIKAVQINGRTGAFLSPDSFDLPIRSVADENMGAFAASGLITVFDSGSCMVEAAGDIMSYVAAQSCGKCLFCREAGRQCCDILADICNSRGRAGDLDLLLELGREMKVACLCPFGKNASNPLLSGIRLFRGEYDRKLGTDP